MGAKVTAKWLRAKARNGRRHIEALGWHRLAEIYVAARPGSDVRRVICAEARRCGYTPTTIVGLNQSQRLIRRPRRAS